MTALADPARVEVPGVRLRPFDPEDDYPALAEFIVSVNRHDGTDYLPGATDLRHDWEGNGGMDPREDCAVADLHGTLVGYVEHDWRVRRSFVSQAIHVAVRPDHRQRGLGRVLLAWAEERVRRGLAAGDLGARSELPQVFTVWGDLEIPEAAPFAAAAGYRVHGYSVTMTRSLATPIPEVPLPAGLEVRPVLPEDHRRIWDADTEAFQDNREPALRTEADFERWFSDPNLDTSLWQVAWDGDEVAGSVMTFVYAQENERLGIRRGLLEHVSVRRPWRRRGLATSLITRSMTLLCERGLEEAALWADAENLTGAVRIYEALGFRRVRTSAEYRKPIDGQGERPEPATG